MKHILIGILAVLFLNSCTTMKDVSVSSLEKELNWLAGEWVGQGFQTDAISNATWEINLNVDMEKRKCKIKYPTLNCGGEWQLIKGNHYSATFKEVIIDGKDKCYNGGQLVITKVNENHLSYSFFYPDNGELGAFSTLIKKDFYKKMNATQL